MLECIVSQVCVTALVVYLGACNLPTLELKPSIYVSRSSSVVDTARTRILSHLEFWDAFVNNALTLPCPVLTTNADQDVVPVRCPSVPRHGLPRLPVSIRSLDRSVVLRLVELTVATCDFLNAPPEVVRTQEFRSNAAGT